MFHQYLQFPLGIEKRLVAHFQDLCYMLGLGFEKMRFYVRRVQVDYCWKIPVKMSLEVGIQMQTDQCVVVSFVLTLF